MNYFRKMNQESRIKSQDTVTSGKPRLDSWLLILNSWFLTQKIKIFSNKSVFFTIFTSTKRKFNPNLLNIKSKRATWPKLSQIRILLKKQGIQHRWITTLPINRERTSFQTSSPALRQCCFSSNTRYHRESDWLLPSISALSHFITFVFPSSKPAPVRFIGLSERCVLFRSCTNSGLQIGWLRSIVVWSSFPAYYLNAVPVCLLHLPLARTVR